MADFDSLKQIMDKQINEMYLVDHQASYATEVFGELHFDKNPQSSSLPSFSSSVDVNPQPKAREYKDVGIDMGTKAFLDKALFPIKESVQMVSSNCDDGISISFEKLQLCNEGLEFKNTDSSNESKTDERNDCKKYETTKFSSLEGQGDIRKSREKNKRYPPPISCVGTNGRPLYRFNSYRHDGRLIMKMTKLPKQDYLHACRENGRLRMYLVREHEELGNQDQDQDDSEIPN